MCSKEKKNPAALKSRREEHNAQSELTSYNNSNVLGLFRYNNTSEAFNFLTSRIKYYSANKMISLKASISEMFISFWLQQKGWGALTLHSQLKRHVGHADHICRDAGEDKAIVIPAYIDKSEVDRVNVWPIDIWLKGSEKKQPRQNRVINVCVYEHLWALWARSKWMAFTWCVLIEWSPFTVQSTSGNGEPEPLQLTVMLSPSITVRLLWVTLISGRSAFERRQAQAQC